MNVARVESVAIVVVVIIAIVIGIVIKDFGANTVSTNLTTFAGDHISLRHKSPWVLIR